MAEQTLLKSVLERHAQSKGMAASQLAESLGMSPSSLSNKVGGRRQLTLEDAHRIAVELGTSLDVIYLLAS